MHHILKARIKFLLQEVLQISEKLQNQNFHGVATLLDSHDASN